MTERYEHCAFARLNPAGRCIAYCQHNRGPVDEDCIGNKGKTIDPDTNDSQHQEIKT
jgi:hypothetical protein